MQESSAAPHAQYHNLNAPALSKPSTNRHGKAYLTDVRRSIPLSDPLEQLVARVLDVAKAHRRILIRASDRGLLCFRHRGRLCQCRTLNFGARVSSFYWARVAGLLLRLLKRLVRVRHSGLIYVDDIISLLNRTSARFGHPSLLSFCAFGFLAGTSSRP